MSILAPHWTSFCKCLGGPVGLLLGNAVVISEDVEGRRIEIAVPPSGNSLLAEFTKKDVRERMHGAYYSACGYWPPLWRSLVIRCGDSVVVLLMLEAETKEYEPK